MAHNKITVLGASLSTLTNLTTLYIEDTQIPQYIIINHFRPNITMWETGRHKRTGGGVNIIIYR